jgi:Na+-driven multidrug efflux pump
VPSHICGLFVLYFHLISFQKKREEAKGFYCLPYRGPVAQEWRRFVDLAGPLIIGYMSVNAMLTEDLAFVGQVRRMFLRRF